MENKEIKKEKKGVVRKIINDLKESTHNVNEINKANLKAEKEAFKERNIDAIKPNEDFENFKKAKGLKAKTKVVINSIKEGAKANSEKEKAKRQEIKNHTAYAELLEEQREKRQPF